MTRRWCFAVAVSSLVLALTAAASSAPDDAARVNALLRDLRHPDFEKSYAAAQALAGYPRHRAQIVPVLVGALRTREWPRCTGDEFSGWECAVRNAACPSKPGARFVFPRSTREKPSPPPATP